MSIMTIKEARELHTECRAPFSFLCHPSSYGRLTITGAFSNIFLSDRVEVTRYEKRSFLTAETVEGIDTI